MLSCLLIVALQVVYHSGAIPGHSILTAFTPRDNLGVSILANADEKAPYLQAILKRTIDDILGVNVSVPLELTRYDHEPPCSQHGTDNMRSTSPERRQTVKATDASPPALNMKDHTGTYRSPGYTPISLCSPLSPSSDCEEVLAEFATLDPPSTANRSLYSAFKSIWATHIRLEYFSGDVFNITFTALFPHGFGKDTSAFETAETGTSDGWVEFVVDSGKVKGFALFIDQNAVAARKRHLGVGNAVPETADAWFAKA